MKILTFNNFKGGVGKTTASLAVGSILASKGYKVLFVDTDPQANLTSAFLSPEKQNNKFAIDIMLTRPINEWGLSIMCVGKRQWLVPASIRIAGMDLLLDQLHKDLKTYNLVNLFMGKWASTFDFIIIDAPAEASLMKINVFMAAHYIYIPALLEDDSLTGAIELVKFINNYIAPSRPNFQIAGVFFNQYDIWSRLARSVAESFTKVFGEKMMVTHIRKNIAVGIAKRNRIGITEYDPNCNAAKDFTALTEEILNNIR